MATYSTQQFKAGLKILLDGEPYSIVENDYVKPGKGQGFNRVKVRNLKTGKVVEKTFKSGDSVDAADVVEREMQYLYNDGDYWYFMDPETFDQYGAPQAVLNDADKFLKDQDVCNVTLYNGEPIAVEPPPHVELQITQTDPGIRGDTSSGGTKPATLETGAVVQVPLFMEEGEVIRVDTRNGTYVSRAKG